MRTYAAVAKSQPVLTRMRASPFRAAGRALLLSVLLLAGAWFRFTGLNWDSGTHVHPDERYITYLASLLKVPDDPAGYFDSGRSPLNPFNTEWGRSYVYGTAPLFATRLLADFFDRGCPGPDAALVPDVVVRLLFANASTLCSGSQFHDYNVIGLLGRAVSAIADVLCVVLVYLIARRLFGWRVGLLAATLYAFAALPIQQAHFFTVDAMANLFVTLTVGACVGMVMSTRATHRSRRLLGWAAIAGVACGLAIASKISVWPLVPLICLSIALAMARWPGRNSSVMAMALAATIVAGIATFATFRVAQPYSFIGDSDLELQYTLQRCGFLSGGMGRLCEVAGELPAPVRSLFAPSGRWIEQLVLAQGFVNGTIDAPFGIQWANRMPVVFPLVNLVFYGLGLPLGIAAVLAVLFAARRMLYGARAYALVPLLAWALPYFLYQSTQWTKSIRYLLPIYPVLCILAAYAVVQFATHARTFRLARLAPTAVALGALLWAFAFTAIYRAPNSRVAASEWMYANIPEGTVVANEHWDEPLPVTPQGYGGPLPRFANLRSSPSGQIESYNEDSPAKLEAILNWLDEADYIVLSSNRIYGATARLPHRYPLTIEYYRALFAGELGFELAADFSSWPRLGPFEFHDQERDQPLTGARVTGIAVPYPPAEEAFSVYDHARVLIFKKQAGYARERVLDRLAHVDTRTHVQSPLESANTPRGLLLPVDRWLAQQAAGTWADLFPRSSLVNQSELVALLIWLLFVQMLALGTWPILLVVLEQFGESALPDAAWGLSKTVGLLLVSWVAWLLASTGLATFSGGLVWLLALALMCLGVWTWLRNAPLIGEVLREHGRAIVCAEAAFFGCLLLMLLARSQNPDLWHPVMGGEKPMDFAYFNAVLKSEQFPPYDPWNAGGYINYYYFGWVLFGAPVKALGIDPAVAYNIVLPTIYGCVAAAAFGAGAALFRINTWQWQPVARRTAELAAGSAAVVLAVLIGNVDQISVLAPALLRLGGAADGTFSPAALATGLQRWFGGEPLPMYRLQLYWDATRLDPAVPIAEFPFFTFLYADLHAHMMAMPLVFGALTLAICFAVTRPRISAVALAGLVLGGLYATNTWDFPAMLVLLIGALLLPALAGRVTFEPPWMPFARITMLGVVAWFAFVPYREHYGTGYNSINWWTAEKTPLHVYLEIYAVFALPLAALWIARLSRELRVPSLAAQTGAVLQFVMVAVATIAGVGLALAGYPAALVALPMVVMCGASAILARRNGGRLFWCIAFGAWALTLVVEIVVLQGDIGRMNTVFKFYLQAWLLLSIATAAALVELFAMPPSPMRNAGAGATQQRSLPGRMGRSFVAALMTVLIGLGLLYPVTALPAKMTDRFAEEAPRGLNGMTYMQYALRREGPKGNEIEFQLGPDFQAIRWLQENVSGTPVVMEGNTGWDLYRWGNRISVYTGLPSVIGWNWHQRQQRAALPDSLVQKREDDVRAFYETSDSVLARQLLDRYQARYVIAGELERAYYGDDLRARMEAHARNGLLKREYTNGATTIYTVLNPIK